MSRKIRVGILGLGPRFETWLHNMKDSPDIEAVAGADVSAAAVTRAKEIAPRLIYFESLEQLLVYNVDVVFLTTPVFIHARDAIRCLRAGKHVLSEVAACWTMAEAVSLHEAAHASDRVYMLAENYCYFPAIQEMRRLFQEGAIGELLTADVHYFGAYRVWWEPCCKRLWDWRNWMPQSYYTTHALGPLLRVTGLRPVSVTGFAVSNNAVSRSIGKLSDEVANFVVELNNGAVVNVASSCIVPKSTELWWHLLGTDGMMENNRYWDTDRGKTLTLLNGSGMKTYQAELPRSKEWSTKGHGGADLFLLADFIRAVRGQAPVSLDVDLAIAMTMPGILAHRSALQGGIKLRVPDLGSSGLRDQYRNDHTSPFPIADNPNLVPPSVLGVKNLDPRFYEGATREDLDLIGRIFGTTRTS